MHIEGTRILLASCVNCRALKNRCGLQAKAIGGVYVRRRRALSPSQGGRPATTRGADRRFWRPRGTSRGALGLGASDAREVKGRRTGRADRWPTQRMSGRDRAGSDLCVGPQDQQEQREGGPRECQVWGTCTWFKSRIEGADGRGMVRATGDSRGTTESSKGRNMRIWSDASHLRWIKSVSVPSGSPELSSARLFLMA